MIYRNYNIERDGTGYAPKELEFSFFLNDEYIGSGSSIEDCKEQINDLCILEN
jgi:hypothetical protein